MPKPDDCPTPAKDIFLESITASEVEAASSKPDALSRRERLDLEYERGVAQLENYKEEIKQRRKYARRIFILTCLWVTAIYGLILLQGFAYKGFHVSDSVLLAAIGTTTANIIGVFLIVAKYLFTRGAVPTPPPPVENI